MYLFVQGMSYYAHDATRDFISRHLWAAGPQTTKDFYVDAIACLSEAIKHLTMISNYPCIVISLFTKSGVTLFDSLPSFKIPEADDDLRSGGENPDQLRFNGFL